MNQLQTQIFDPFVRQLLFSVFGQDLINTCPSPISLNDEYRAFFIALEKKPQNLHTFLKQYENTLLGGWFESLWLFFFNHAPGWQVLATNLQINDATRTLGELDILAKHRTSGNYHFELAVKFYLLIPGKNGRDLHHWVGPNSRDNLEIKLKHLQQHQLPMLYREESQTELNRLKIPTIEQQNVILKGNLLLPAITSTSLNLSTSIDSTQGYWLHASQLPTFFTCDTSWVILSKPQWLCPFLARETSTDITIYNTLQIIEIITVKQTNKHFKPMLIAQLIAKQGIWQEQKRYMIVADDWPAEIKN